MRNIYITLIVTIISVTLCTLGFSPTSVPINSIGTIWPGAITQAVVSILFGGWGVIATILSGILVDIINVGKIHVIFGFVLPDFIQAFIPAYYYRRKIKQHGWKNEIFAFKPFFIFAVLLPNTIGAIIAALWISHTESVSFQHSMIRWMIANVPIATILGWPLLKILGPILVEEGWVVSKWWK